MKIRTTTVILYGLLLAVQAGAQVSIVDSAHNLSSSGPGPVQAIAEDRVCIFCHTPHGARTNAPLWNRNDSTATYLPYDSPTLKATVGQPTGASKLCLSCHDGTIALGDLVDADQPVAMAGSPTMPAGGGLIGTDLRDDHPISFDYYESLALGAEGLTQPAQWDQRVRLDAQQQMQCTTCHDPHDNQWGEFLVMDNAQAMLCRQCHQLDDFDQTPHALSAATWKGGGANPWPHTELATVQSNACMNCHASHHAGGEISLLTQRDEEQTCLVCHNGNVARDNVAAVVRKRSAHAPERYTGMHRANETAEQAATHVECADCHNPHRARALEAEAPFIQGAMAGVSGVDASGLAVGEAIYEYQVCFKCHGAQSRMAPDAVPRQVASLNTINEFNPASPSFHPVVASGRGADVPSLLAPMNPGSMIYCTDCHGNDGAGVGEAAGPHGSNFDYMLKLEYRTGDPVAESPASYALCYNCHSRASILGDESFPAHRAHVAGGNISCSVCHDAHGIDFGKGNEFNNAHLINFDVSVVRPDALTGRLEYRSLGPRAGECTMSCHGVNHSGVTY